MSSIAVTGNASGTGTQTLTIPVTTDQIINLTTAQL
jgi:hypothetical protein